MLRFNTNTKQIQINRGDSADLTITAKDKSGETYMFQQNDVVKFKVSEAKNEANVVIEKSVTVAEEADNVIISLTSEDTKIGDYINKPVTYWYEISIERNNGDVFTIIGYEDGDPKEFVLNPEAGDKQVEAGDIND